MTVPNILSVFRIALIPLFYSLFFSGKRVAAFAVIILSGLTDIADGFIARKFNQRSKLGEVLDPLADKLFHISMILCLTIDGKIDIIFPVLIAVKEVTMIIGGAVLYKKEQETLPARWYGKAATVFFFASYIISFLLEFIHTNERISTLILTLMLSVAVLFSVFVFISYAKAAKEIYKKKKITVSEGNNK